MIIQNKQIAISIQNVFIIFKYRIGLFVYPFCIETKKADEKCENLSTLRCIKEFGCNNQLPYHIKILGAKTHSGCDIENRICKYDEDCQEGGDSKAYCVDE